MNKAAQSLVFPWFSRCNGGLFFASGVEVVKVCPFCGHDGQTPDDTYPDAFESGHLRRVWGEEFGIK